MTTKVEKHSGELGSISRSRKPRRALIVTPSSTKAMDVSGGVAKVILLEYFCDTF